MRATIERCELPLATPLKTARGTLRSRTVFLLRFEREGVVGIGEAAPLAAAGTEGVAATRAALSRALELIESGALAWSEPGGWEPILLGALGGAPAARHAVDVALWDWSARRAGRSLAGLLSDDPASSVRVNALLAGEDVGRQARDAAASGFTIAKLKVGGRDLAEDAARLAAIRREAPGLGVRLDANGGWPNGRAALAALRALDADTVDAIEQPVPPHDRFGLSWLRARVAPAVAADESVVDERTGLDLVDEGVADAIVLKPMKLGGLGACMRLAAHARAAGLRVWLTTTIDAAVARAAAVHLAAAIDPDGEEAHGLATGPLLAADVAPGLPLSAGTVVVPAVPGLGIEPDSVRVPST